MECFCGGKVYYFDGLSLPESMFLSNIFSWSKKKNFKGAVYKKDSEMADEIHCDYHSVRRIRSKLAKLGFFKIGKRENLKFNGSTPYFLNVEKIVETGNSKIIFEINSLKIEGVSKRSTPSVEKFNSLCRNVKQGVSKTSTPYTDTDAPSIHSEENPLPPYKVGDSSPRLSNEFLDSKFQEFLEIANFPDYPLSKQQEARALFFGQLQSDLGEHTLDDFLDCAGAYYVDDRPTDPKYIIRPHNFISKKQVGTNHRINPWKDWIGKKKPKQKTEEEKQEELLARIRKEYEARGENCYV
jgi:hypothetical protein